MINITSKDFKVTSPIKKQLDEKLGKLHKYSDKESEVNVVLSDEPNGKKIEILYNLDGKIFKAEGLDEDLYSSMDIVIKALQKQVRRFVDKQKDKDKDSIRFHTEYNKPKEEISEEPRIVKRKVISAKPMFEQEAILQMDVLDHRSFMFYNADTNTPCMIYKRHDGDYGMIETDLELQDNM